MKGRAKTIDCHKSVERLEYHSNNAEEQNLHGRLAYDLEAPDVDKMASNPWLNFGEIFPEPAGLMKAIQDRFINVNNYKKYIL
jgi:hypothetical protein